LIKVASFDEARPATDMFAQGWSAEDSDAIVDLVDNDVKPKPEIAWTPGGTTMPSTIRFM
jgi:hypothetical protein